MAQRRRRRDPAVRVVLWRRARHSGVRRSGRPQCEDHPAGDGLEDARDRHVELALEVAAAALDDDHRAVVEERDALAGLLALLDDLDPERFAGQERRLDRVRELVEVDDPDALELGDPVEVVVGGQDGARRGAGRGRRAWRRPSTSPARPRRSARGRRDGPSGGRTGRRARAVRGSCATGSRVVGDVLELAEHEAGHDQRAAEEARGDDVDDAAVDDGAGVDVGRRAADRRRRRHRRAPASRMPRSLEPPRSRSSRLATVRPIMPEARARPRRRAAAASRTARAGWRAAARAGGPSAGRDEAGDRGHELAGGHVGDARA